MTLISSSQNATASKIGWLGKPSESFEQYTSDKQGLVAVDDPAADATEIIEERDQLEPPNHRQRTGA